MLIGNGSVLHKSPGRFLNGYGTAGGGIATMRSALNKHGMQRNAYQAYSANAATPYGHLSPSAWVLPKTAGGMSSRNVTTLAVSSVGAAVGGITADAFTGFAFTVAPAAGQLISSGTGSASFSISSNTPLLTASLSAVGTASFTFAGAAALTGKGGMVAAASFAFAPAATILPTNDASPLQGSTVGGGAMTEATIAAAVLAAAASAPIAADIRKINATTVTGDGSPGTPWGP
jgi:hypothetical protein